MFSVIFEVRPRKEMWDVYLADAVALRTEIDQVDGFVDSTRFKSLTRDGWVLSLSSWRDEKSVVRWRTNERHHDAQETARNENLSDYHLRVGQVIQDTGSPVRHTPTEQQLDETEAGEGTALTLVSARRPKEFKGTANPADCSEYLGLDPYAEGMLNWDVFEALQTPGDLVLLLSWRDRSAAESYENLIILPEGHRLRRVSIVRDYSMRDRREAPQYFPPVASSPS